MFIFIDFCCRIAAYAFVVFDRVLLKNGWKCRIDQSTRVDLVRARVGAKVVPGG